MSGIMGFVSFDNANAPPVPGFTRTDITGQAGSTTFHAVSLATANATNVKSSAARLYAVYAAATVATTRWLKFFNKASAPTLGTDVPVKTIQIPASGSVNIGRTDFPALFPLGLSFAITANPGDLDATAVAAGDVIVDIDYV